MDHYRTIFERLTEVGCWSNHYPVREMCRISLPSTLLGGQYSLNWKLAWTKVIWPLWSQQESKSKCCRTCACALPPNFWNFFRCLQGDQMTWTQANFVWYELAYSTSGKAWNPRTWLTGNTGSGTIFVVPSQIVKKWFAPLFGFFTCYYITLFFRPKNKNFKS